MCGANVPYKRSNVCKFFFTFIDETLSVVFHIIGLDVLCEMLLSEVLFQLCWGTGVEVAHRTGTANDLRPLRFFFTFFRNNLPVGRHLYLLIQLNLGWTDDLGKAKVGPPLPCSTKLGPDAA